MADIYTKYFEGIENGRFRDFIDSDFDQSILSIRYRLLSLLAAAQAKGEYDILAGLIRWSVDCEISLDEIYEVLLQGHLFIGYPKALESFFIFKDVCEKYNLNFQYDIHSTESWDQALFEKRGLDTAREIYGRNFELVHSNITALAPDLALGMIYEGYGRIISRSRLGLKERELAIVSVLTVNYMPRQLYSHIRGAANVGVAKRQIEAAIRQCRAFTENEIIEKAVLILEKSLGK